MKLYYMRKCISKNGTRMPNAMSLDKSEL